MSWIQCLTVSLGSDSEFNFLTCFSPIALQTSIFAAEEFQQSYELLYFLRPIKILHKKHEEFQHSSGNSGLFNLSTVTSQFCQITKNNSYLYLFFLCGLNPGEV